MNRLLLGKTGTGSAVKRETGASRGGGAVRREIEASNSGPVKKKKTQGRRKIEIKKIENESHRQATFSKRRVGLFKKAGELSILCGVDVAIIVKSPGGKRFFSFGHPSTNSVVDRFLRGDAAAGEEEGEEVKSSNAAEQKEEAEEFNLHYSKVREELQMEKKIKEETEEEKKSAVYAGEDYWWNMPVDGLGLEELEEYLAALEELSNKVAMKADESRSLKSPTMLPPPPLGPEIVGNQDVDGHSGLLNDVSRLLNLNPFNSGSDYYNNFPIPQGHGDTMEHGHI